MKNLIIETREELLALKRVEKWQEIVKKVRALDQEVLKDGTILMCFADSLYESGDDLDALEYYVKYVCSFPNGKAKNFALFNIGLCLSNLGMYEESLEFFERTDEGHPSRVKLISETCEAIEKVRVAKGFLRKAVRLSKE